MDSQESITTSQMLIKALDNPQVYHEAKLELAEILRVGGDMKRELLSCATSSIQLYMIRDAYIPGPLEYGQS